MKIATPEASAPYGPATPAERVDNARRLVRAGEIQLGMRELALAFHALERVRPDGIDPFDAPKLLAWVEKGAAARSELRCAHFVLCIYNLHETEQALGVFGALDAIASWDRSHRSAFAEWARDPFFA